MNPSYTDKSQSKLRFQQYKPRIIKERKYDPICNPDPFHYMNPSIEKEMRRRNCKSMKELF